MGTLNRVLVPFFIIALPVTAMIAFINYYYRSKQNMPPATPTAPRTVSFGTHEWPVFRGDSAFRGLAAGSLPDALKLSWRFETRNAIKSTPAVADGIVFIASMDKNVYAVDLKTGQEKWRFTADDALEASPLVTDGTVYIGSAYGTFYAVSADTGRQRWTFQTNGKIIGSANTFIDPAGQKRRIVFGSYDNFLYCLNADDGALLWKHEAQNYINGSPAIADNAAIFGSCDGNLYVVPLEDPQKTSTIDIESYMAASPAIENGIIYAANYEGLCIAARQSNGQILWQFRQKDIPFLTSPAVTAEYVLFGARDKTLYCLNRTDGAVVWTFSSTAAIDSSPVVCGNKVVFGSDNGRFYIVDLADGKEVFAYTLGKAVSAGPAVADNSVLLGCEDGAVYAFTAK